MQISDENLHHVRELMDEVFGAENFVRLITFRDDSQFGSSTALGVESSIICFGMRRDADRSKYRQLYSAKALAEDIGQRVTTP